MSYRLRFRGSGYEFTPIEATGGSVVQCMINNRLHKVHYFYSPGESSFTLNRFGSDPEIKYLVIGGGGGGGSSSQGLPGGGGGSSGQVISGSYHFLEEKSLSISIGAGGAAGQNGAASSLGSSGTDIYVLANGGASGSPSSGVGGAGSSGPATGIIGGPGTSSIVNGISSIYGIGGDAGQSGIYGTTPSQFGSGGGGSAPEGGNTLGFSGRPGVVIIAYPIAPKTGYENPGVPDKPAAPTAVPGILHDIVSWTAVSDNGSAIIEYEWDSSDGKTGTTTSLSVNVVQDAENPQTYRVRARNSIGYGGGKFVVSKVLC